MQDLVYLQNSVVVYPKQKICSVKRTATIGDDKQPKQPVLVLGTVLYVLRVSIKNCLIFIALFSLVLLGSLAKLVL